MPHIVIEYSKNIAKEIKRSDITAKTQEYVADCGLFSPDAVKARSISYSDYVLPKSAENFVHITVSILTGRNIAQRENLSKEIFNLAKNVIDNVDKLSVNIHEMVTETYSK